MFLRIKFLKIIEKIKSLFKDSTHPLTSKTKRLWSRRHSPAPTKWTIWRLLLFTVLLSRILRMALFAFAWKYGWTGLLKTDPFLLQARLCFPLLTSHLCLAFACTPFAFLAFQYGVHFLPPQIEPIDWFAQLLIDNSRTFWRVMKFCKPRFNLRQPVQSGKRYLKYMLVVWETRRHSRRRYFPFRLSHWKGLGSKLRVRVILLTWVSEGVMVFLAFGFGEFWNGA